MIKFINRVDSLEMRVALVALIEERVEQSMSSALGGMQMLRENAAGSLEAHCFRLKLELEARLRADVRAQLPDLDAKVDQGARLRTFPSIPAFLVPD